MPKKNRIPKNGIVGWSANRSTDPIAREAYNAYMRSLRKKPEHSAKAATTNKAWRTSERGRSWTRTYRLARYGITPEIYDATLLAQGGKCAICKSESSANNRGWHIDHCHKTGKFRGLLCVPCNLGLGHFKDSLTILDAAKNYLTKE